MAPVPLMFLKKGGTETSKSLWENVFLRKMRNKRKCENLNIGFYSVIYMGSFPFLCKTGTCWDGIPLATILLGPLGFTDRSVSCKETGIVQDIFATSRLLSTLGWVKKSLPTSGGGNPSQPKLLLVSVTLQVLFGVTSWCLDSILLGNKPPTPCWD